MSQKPEITNIKSKSNTKITKELNLYNDRFGFKEAANLLNPNITGITKKSKSKSPNVKLPTISKNSTNVMNSYEQLLDIDPEVDYKKNLDRLETVWQQKNIPNHAKSVFMNCLSALPRQKAINVLTTEIKNLQENCAPVQLVIKSVKSREESLESIFELNRYLQSTDWINLKEVHLQSAELLHGHRLFTLSVVENIIKWKEMLTNSLIINNSEMKLVEYKENNTNYLAKMRSDLDFLTTSEFAKILNFAEGDPLLITPSIPSGKKERGRKRDPNYFIDEGQVIVPIPSFLINRVKEAEDAIRREYDYVKFLEENTPERQAALFGPQILLKIIEEVVEEGTKEIQDDVKKIKKLEKIKKQEQKTQEKLNKDINEVILNQFLIEELIKIIEKEVIFTKQSISDTLADELSEKLLSDYFASNIFDLVNLEYQDFQAQKDYEEKLAKEKKHDLEQKILKEAQIFLFEKWQNEILQEIVKETIEELKKQKDDENKMYSIKSPLMEEIGLDFACMENFVDLSEMKWVPLNLPEELIVDILNEYYSISPDINHTILPNIENLLIEITKYMDTCWYWALKGSLILGLLVCSVDCYNKTGRKIIVHHISSLYWNSFSFILESATNYLWSIDSCDEIRINLFTKTEDSLTPEVKKIFTQLNYKWKTKYSVVESNSEIVVLGKSKKDKINSLFIPFKLNCWSVITTKKETKFNPGISPEILTIGNRQNMLNSLLCIFGNIENSKLKLAPTSNTKLQGVVTSLLSQMSENQCFSFPFMSSASNSTLADFLSTNKIPLPNTSASASVLDIKFRWISCTNSIQNIRGQNYRFLRFKSKDLKFSRVLDVFTYYVPVELPNLVAFFITSSDILSEISKEVNRKELDMFATTEKFVVREGLETATEVWVPCFKVFANWKVPWIEGYEIPSQTEENSLFVDECYENIELGMETLDIPNGLLSMNNKYGPVLMSDFVFGLQYSKGDRVLDIPLFSCLVKESDWIKA